jgi:holin-like protein
MKLFNQLLIIFLFTIFAEAIVILSGLRFPSSILAMLLVLVFLHFKWLKTEQIQELSDFFLMNMGFFFIPAAVGVIDKLPLLNDKIYIILFIAVVTTIITFLVTTLAVAITVRIQNKVVGKDE